MGIIKPRRYGWLWLLPGLALGAYSFLAGREVFLGRQAQTAGDFGAASGHYLAAAGYLPWQTDLWRQAGRSAFEAGAGVQTVEILTRPEMAAALNAADLLLLGDAYSQLGDKPNAVKAWQQALSLDQIDDPGLVETLYARLILAHQQSGDFVGEAQARQALAKLKPTDAQNLFRLGELLCALDPPAAPAYLEQAAAHQPGLQPAAALLQEAVQQGGLSDDPAYAFLQTGRALMASGELNLARHALQNAARINPAAAEVWAFLAESYQQIQPPDEKAAQSALEKAFALNPDSLAVNALYGLYWQRQSQPGRALGYLEKAAVLEPGNPLWLVSIGQVKSLLGNLGAAEAMYLEAVRLAPRQAEYQRLLAEFYIQYQVKIVDGALPAAHQAVVLDPQSPACQDVLGQALFLSGDRDGALQAYQAALALDGSYALAGLHLGVLYAEEGSAELARQYLEQAQAVSPDPAVQDQAARLLAFYFP